MDNSNNIENNWKKQIPSSLFRVISADSENELENVSIIINGKNIKQKIVFFFANELQSADIQVSAKGYIPQMEEGIDLINNASQRTYRLTKKNIYKSYNIKLANGKIADMELKSTDLDDQTSPLSAYKIKDDTLVLNGSFIWKQRLYGAIISILIIVILAASYFIFAPSTKPSSQLPNQPTESPVELSDTTRDEKTQTNPIADIIDTTTITTADKDTASNTDKPLKQTDSNTKTTIENESNLASLKAIAYLDNNTIWYKDSVAKYPELNGLMNDLANVNVKNLKHWGSTTLKNSSRFASIYKAVINMERRGASHNGSDITRGGTKSTIKNYVKYLNSL